ncbi:probable GTP diphosphokinase RSH2, chloroplastic [Punica granatum]|uniref:GTP diphosphokinase n=2 Tax=Punica granatum TaxID=22663 RepID=A0A218X3T7_PUNGR|nr:probable GTP diphosphokinase RSH2, chloroplastic [Punica granatum]OWM79915.1 hypothetical protein CDL15_Pgr001558 [Punica granatum]PKI41639.1 hypothetical protein CRG98_037946 [Punica granatum]
MAVPTIALYATSPPHQFSSHLAHDFEFSPRSSPSPSSSSSSSSQRQILGGLSRLFSSPTQRSIQSSSPSFSGDERSEELKELSGSYSGRFIGSLKKEYSTPVSVLPGPGSCSSSSSYRSSAMFSGFVRSALGSCIDYDSPRSDFRGPGAVDAVELTFNLEEGAQEGDLEPYAKELLLSAQRRHKIFYEDLVLKAFHEAEKAHRGQIRASGDPYLKHCVETAVLLALIGANSVVVAAGLLHDTIDDSFMSYDYILRIFGANVADLVQGVSKLSHLSKLARESNTASRANEADRLHTMFLAMADARAVLIKLADRLHNMMTLEALCSEKRKRFAKETLEIFAPLANRLGISSWKERLENLCFRHLDPIRHGELSSRLLESFDEDFITSAVEKLKNALKEKSVSNIRLSGRHKSLYSVHRKMLKKSLSVDEIHDIHGLRLIVESKEDCYRALEIVHKLWREVPGKFKDYIIHPKFNGYQSLHTVVIGEGMVPFEVQIRTREMHLQAEFGFAAHWRYKEGDCEHSSFILQMVEWARWVVTWQCETMDLDRPSIRYTDSIMGKSPCTFPSHSRDCPYYCKPHSNTEGPVFVIVIENDKMSVRELPANSLVMDLLESTGQIGTGSKRWTQCGGFPVKEELRPRLNRQPVVDPTCRLRMGDVVELTPTLPDRALTEYREEIQRMYDGGVAAATTAALSRRS